MLDEADRSALPGRRVGHRETFHVEVRPFRQPGARRLGVDEGVPGRQHEVVPPVDLEHVDGLDAQGRRASADMSWFTTRLGRSTPDSPGRRAPAVPTFSTSTDEGSSSRARAVFRDTGRVDTPGGTAILPP